MSDNAHTSRLELIVGAEGLARLGASHVLVLGLGGVGSACAESLARSGVGALTLVDRDIVQESNLNRQVVARISTLGQPKVEAMRDLIADINPDCKVDALHIYLEGKTLSCQLDEISRPDYVVDAIDTITQKLNIYAWCNTNNVPLVSSMGSANKLDPCRFRFADISKSHGDPMARVLRKECRRRGIRGVEVLYSDEPALHIDAIDEFEGKRPHDKGEILGTMSYLPPVMGYMLASKVIRELVWSGEEHPS